MGTNFDFKYLYQHWFSHFGKKSFFTSWEKSFYVPHRHCFSSCRFGCHRFGWSFKNRSRRIKIDSKNLCKTYCDFILYLMANQESINKADSLLWCDTCFTCSFLFCAISTKYLLPTRNHSTLLLEFLQSAINFLKLFTLHKESTF